MPTVQKRTRFNIHTDCIILNSSTRIRNWLCLGRKELKEMDELTFQEWLLVYQDFNKDDIENLLSSDELAELHEEYEEWLSQQ